MINAMLNLVVPAMEMIFRLLEDDSQAFNAALEKAQNLHKKHFGNDEQMSDNPRGFIAITPLGITCYAYDGHLVGDSQQNGFILNKSE